MARFLQSSLLRRRFAASDGEGFTFLEMMAALAVALIFMAALYTSFISMLRRGNEMEAELNALRNGRMGTFMIMCDLKNIDDHNGSFQTTLIGIDAAGPFAGDARDNDGDGAVDEEFFDGLDDDGDYVVGVDDRHTTISAASPSGFVNIHDRFQFTEAAPYAANFTGSNADLGDVHVDEDVRFGRDTISFTVIPDNADPDLISQTITYSIGTWDSKPYTLIREVRSDYNTSPSTTIQAPMAFNCLSLHLLYWNPNAENDPGFDRADRQYWQLDWDSTNSATFNAPQLPLPASVFIYLTVYADPRPISTYDGQEPVRVYNVPCMANIEPTIMNPLYERPTLQPWPLP